MPRRGKGPRLWLQREVRKGGVLVRHATWVILDGKNFVRTGCTRWQAGEAEQRLAEYITGKHTPARDERSIEKVPIGDVLSIYLEDRKITDKKWLKRIARLNDFFGSDTLAEFTKARCRQYAKVRGNPGGARRDLEDLRSAINHHAEEGLHRAVIKVWLPEGGMPRDRWLTRDEAAKLLWTCWRTKEIQRRHRGADKGKRLPVDKYPLRHLARFIILGLYTGSRAAPLAQASIFPGPGRSYVDLEAGLFYRKPPDARVTKKRQTPVPIPDRALAHMRRWKRLGVIAQYVVEYQGQPVRSVKTAMKSAVKKAELEGQVTPHTLRHTAATWLMQAGTSPWQAAGFLAMSVEMIERVYGHHHPDYLRGAKAALGNRRRTGNGLAMNKHEQT